MIILVNISGNEVRRKFGLCFLSTKYIILNDKLHFDSKSCLFAFSFPGFLNTEKWFEFGGFVLKKDGVLRFRFGFII